MKYNKTIPMIERALGSVNWDGTAKYCDFDDDLDLLTKRLVDMCVEWNNKNIGSEMPLFQLKPDDSSVFLLTPVNQSATDLYAFIHSNRDGRLSELETAIAIKEYRHIFYDVQSWYRKVRSF